MTVSNLRIGCVGLPIKDVAYIRALSLLFSYGSSVPWVFADEAPYDALVVNNEKAAAARKTHRCAVLLLQGSKAAPVQQANLSTIDYPIRADQFKTWLRAKTVELLQANADMNGNGGIFKLRKWPPASLMQGEAAYIRMAAMLSNKPMGIATLSQLSGKTVTECAEFMEKLKAADLLVEIPVGTAPSAISYGTSGPAAEPQSATQVSHGLLGSIRRRLRGLWA